MKSPPTYTRFEKARIVGARALQVGMGAPVLIKHDKAIQNPVELALLEFDKDLIPITVKRSVPPRAAQYVAGLGGDAQRHTHG